MNPKSAKLSCHTGALAGTAIKINQDILIGRKQSCDLVLYPHSVSGQHARLFFDHDDGHYYIEDLGSSNGTWVDRTKVDQPTKLDSLSVITFANNIDFIFHCPEHATSTDGEVLADPTVFDAPPSNRGQRHTTEYQQSFSPPPPLSQQASPKERPKTEFMQSFSPPPSFEQPPRPPRPEKDAKEAPGKSFTPPPNPKKAGAHKTAYNKSIDPPLASSKKREARTLVVDTKGNKAQFTLRPGKNTVGRSSSADITISDPFISSSHAVIDLKPDGRIVLEDMKSSNKTYVNGQSIVKPVVIQKGMKIRFGPNSEAIILSS